MKRIGVIILGIAMFCTLNYSVKAENISYQRLNDIYYNLTVDGVTTSNHVTEFFLDGRLAYCIDPGAPITTKTYNSSTDWSNISLTDEQKQQIEKIGYYGYEYPNHATDRYYIATQELIWKVIKNVDIKWTNGAGQIIDVSKEKNEIESLINKHSIVPSFVNETITATVGETKEITDTNNILDNFTLSSPQQNNIKVTGNKLEITFSESPSEEQINLTRKVYDQKTLLIYQYPGSQSLAAIRLNYQENLNFKIKSEEKKKEVVKVPDTGITTTTHFGVQRIKTHHDNKFS